MLWLYWQSAYKDDVFKEHMFYSAKSSLNCLCNNGLTPVFVYSYIQ